MEFPLARTLAGLIRRASLEDPAVPLSAWRRESPLLGGGGSSISGVDVTIDKALTVAAVYRAVDLISRTVAKLPVMVYARSGGGHERDPAHPAYDLLRRRPNDWMTGFDFRRLMTAQVLLWGNSYALIDRDARMRPVALLPLDPDPSVTVPVRRNGQAFVVSHLGRPTQAVIPARDVLHVKGLGFDGLCGVSVVRYAAESLGLTIAGERFGAVYFRNAATPRVILEHPGNISEEASKRLAASFQAMHSGIENAHRTAVLEEGMTAKALSMSAKDAQLLEARVFQIREVALWFGLPPHKVGDESRTSFASLEQENQAFLDDSIDPWLVTWEQELEAKLLTEAEKDSDSHSIEHIRQALARADMGARIAFYSGAIQNGMMSPDEARARESMDPIPDGAGAVYFRPLNVAVVGEDDSDEDPPVPPAPDPEPEPEGDRMDRGAVLKAARASLEDAVGRAARRIVRAAGRAAKDPEAFVDRVDALRGDHLAVMVEVLGPATAIAGAALGRAVDVEALAGSMLEDAAAGLLEAAECPAGDLGRRVEEWGEAWGRRSVQAVERILRGADE